MNSYIKYGWLVAILLAVGIVAVGASYQWAIEFSGFAWFILLAGGGLFIWSQVDTWLLRLVDTLQQIQNGNVAVALYMLSAAIIIAAAIVAA
jgi:hypothetical protein